MNWSCVKQQRAQQHRYDACGETLDTYTATSGAVDSPWRYQGRVRETASTAPDLYDFSARSYDPGLGAFTSFDSVAGSAQNPLTLNRYLYANANPATLIDPDGHNIQDIRSGTCVSWAYLGSSLSCVEWGDGSSLDTTGSTKKKTKTTAQAPMSGCVATGDCTAAGGLQDPAAVLQADAPLIAQASATRPNCSSMWGRAAIHCASAASSGVSPLEVVAVAGLVTGAVVACIFLCEEVLPAAAACAASGICEGAAAATGTAATAECTEGACQAAADDATALIDDATAGAAGAEPPTEIVSQLPRVGSALKPDLYHAIPNEVLDNPAATKFPLLGGDGVTRSLYQLLDVVNGKSGVWSWIVDPNLGITHTFFTAGGTVNGIP
jgi:RHS repeat-associated protein